MIEYKVRVYEDRTVWLNQKDKFHRLDGPAVEWKDGSREWWVDGKLHRLDGPAVEWKNGDREWWIEGKRHRFDGPAIEYANGYKVWWVDGKCHRFDGLAIEYANGSREWWIDGVGYSKEDFHKKVREMSNSCEGKVVEIDGKKYKLVGI